MDFQELTDLVMQETHKCKGEVSALHKIKEIAHKHFKKEICGFLGYDQKNKEFIVRLEDNASEDPRSYFLINPLSYLLFNNIAEESKQGPSSKGNPRLQILSQQRPSKWTLAHQVAV